MISVAIDMASFLSYRFFTARRTAEIWVLILFSGPSRGQVPYGMDAPFEPLRNERRDVLDTHLYWTISKTSSVVLAEDVFVLRAFPDVLANYQFMSCRPPQYRTNDVDP